MNGNSYPRWLIDKVIIRYKHGGTCSGIAKELSLSSRTVHRWVKAEGINRTRKQTQTGVLNSVYKGGHINKSGYRVLSINGKNIKEHRLFVERSIGRKLRRTEHVHHINGNKLDNSKENLKIVSPAQHPKEHAYKGTKSCKTCGGEFKKDPRTSLRYFLEKSTYCSVPCRIHRVR